MADELNCKLVVGVLVALIHMPLCCYSQLPSVVRIGAIFDEDAVTEEAAFKYAIEEINRNTLLNSVKLSPIIERSRNAYQASKKVCKMLKSRDELTNSSGIAAIFANVDESSTNMIDSLSEILTIPMIQSSPDFSTLRSDVDEIMTRMKVNLYPDTSSLSDALLDFVEAFHWKQLVILYKGNHGLIRVKSILNSGFMHMGGDRKFDVVLWEMKDIEKTLKELRYNVPYRHVIVDIDADDIPHFLDTASRMGILTSYHHYMFTSLDLQAINIGRFTIGGVNITGFRMLNTDSSVSRRHLREWVLQSVRPQTEFKKMLHNCSAIKESINTFCSCAAKEITCDENDNITYNVTNVTDKIVELCTDPECRWLFRLKNALVVDAVESFAKALRMYFDGLDSFSTKAISCSSKSGEEAWPPGESIYNQFSAMSYPGWTGPIRIDNKGRRTDFDLELIEYNTDGEVRLLGNWTRAKGLRITKLVATTEEEIKKDLSNKTLRVVVKREEPFIMYRESRIDGSLIPANSNERFYGYAIDMMEEISKILNLTYEIHLVHDEVTGEPLENGSWTGMIGELMTNKADLALGDLTINFERSKVIDFTKPFMNLGISILFKRPEPEPPKLFSFLEPLDNKIWMCMIGAYAFVSLFLFVVARFSPYEWKNPHPCNPESDLVENEFTLLNSFWFTIGSLMQQGCELAPKASSTRIIAGVWWFFTLILISSYTANLAAFLTITRMSTPIKNADDLSKQTAIKYGCYRGGSTYRFFKNSKIPTYERMWNFMEQNPDVFVNNSKLAIAKVKAGKYAYLMESVPLRYQLSKHCDLMEVGGELDSKGYGIGVPKDSPFRDSLSNAILSLSEQQVLLNLYNKWWNTVSVKKFSGTEVDNSKCSNSEDSKSANTASQLGMANLGGVFVFLIGGLALALFIALIEFLINAFVNSKTDKQTLCSEVKEECTFAIKCWGPSEKPIKSSQLNGNVKLDDDEFDSSHPPRSDVETSFTYHR